MAEYQIQTVSALLRSPDGLLLLHLRDDRPDLRYPGCWSTLGGRVEPGEHPDKAMRRELLEEIELAPEMRHWKTYDYAIHDSNGDSTMVQVHVYIGEIDRGIDEITLNEGQMLGLFGPDDLDAIPVAFGFRALFKEFFFSGAVRR